MPVGLNVEGRRREERGEEGGERRSGRGRRHAVEKEEGLLSRETKGGKQGEGRRSSRERIKGKRRGIRRGIGRGTVQMINKSTTRDV